MTPNWEALREEFETTDIQPKALAEKHGIPYDTVKSRKKREKWEKRKGAPPLSERVHPQRLQGAPSAAQKRKRGAPLGNQNAKGHGAPEGNQNAIGNEGGAPPENDNAVTHGLFRKFLPDDPETREIFDNANHLGAADMIWLMIRTKFTAIIRAQKIMFVTDHDDLTKELKRTKQTVGDDTMTDEREWEIQFAWDKHAAFLTAQARAMSELRSLIRQFREMTGADDKRRLELERMQQAMVVERERLQIEKEKLQLAKEGKNGASGSNSSTAHLSDEELEAELAKLRAEEGEGVIG